MIYRNDNIGITDTYVKGTIKDLMVYFRYEIASQCMSGTDCDYENFSHNVKEIMTLLDKLYEYTFNGTFKDDYIVKVIEHPMGSFMIGRDEE